jgi:hypothetical protein
VCTNLPFRGDAIVNVCRVTKSRRTTNDVVNVLERSHSSFFFFLLDIIENTLLSPGVFQASNYRPCGYCADDNAACVRAANQTTCWCRAGYEKFGDRCGQLLTEKTRFESYLAVFSRSQSTNESTDHLSQLVRCQSA